MKRDYIKITLTKDIESYVESEIAKLDWEDILENTGMLAYRNADSIRNAMERDLEKMSQLIELLPGAHAISYTENYLTTGNLNVRMEITQNNDVYKIAGSRITKNNEILYSLR